MYPVTVADGEGVGVGAAVTVGAGVGVGVTTGAGVAFTVGVGVAARVGVGTASFAGTPWLQTNFFPLLMQVYFKPLTVAVAFTFAQLAPLLTAAFTGGMLIIDRATTNASNFFMGKRYKGRPTSAA